MRQIIIVESNILADRQIASQKLIGYVHTTSKKHKKPVNDMLMTC